MLDFPNLPKLDQIFTAAGKQWKWNGMAWKAIGGSGSGGGTGTTTGSLPTPAQIGAVNKAGDTLTGKLNFPASTLSKANLNLATGVAPTTPVDGDIFYDGRLKYGEGGNNRTVAVTERVNAFTVYQTITVTNATNPALTVTQNGNGGGLKIVNPAGTGESLRIEDESPETSPFVVSASGKVGIGTTPDASVGLKVDSSGIKFSDGTIQTTAFSTAADGREVEFQKSATHIQWRYVGDLTWGNLVALDDLRGADGNDGAAGTDALWNFTGAYNPGLPYAVGDVATYDGETWYRKNSNGGNVGDTPSEGTFWTKLAQKGAGEITHASNHATGAVDALTPADIGAVKAFQIEGNPPETNIAPAAMELRDNEDPSGIALKYDGTLLPQDNPWAVTSNNLFREAIGAAPASHTHLLKDLEIPSAEEVGAAPLSQYLSIEGAAGIGVGSYVFTGNFQNRRPIYQHTAYSAVTLQYENDTVVGYWAILDDGEEVRTNHGDSFDPSKLASNWRQGNVIRQITVTRLDNNRITLGTPDVAEGRLVLRSYLPGEPDRVIFNDEGTLVLDRLAIELQNTGVYSIALTTEQLTASQRYTLPNASGTLALDGHVHPLPTPADIGAAASSHIHDGDQLTSSAVHAIELQLPSGVRNAVFYPLENGYNSRPLYTAEPDLVLWYDETVGSWHISEGDPFISSEKIVASSYAGEHAHLPIYAEWGETNMQRASLNDITNDLRKSYVSVSTLKHYRPATEQNAIDAVVDGGTF